MSDPILSQNKATVRRSIDELWNKRNLSIMDELWDESYANRTVPEGSPQATREGWKSTAAAMHASLPPDYGIVVHELIAEGDKVLARWTEHGTHTVPLFDLPPSGRYIEWHGMSLHRLENGRIVEEWYYSDFADVVQALRAELQQA